MIAHCEWKGDGFFESQSESGHTVVFDADPAHEEGPSPMKAVLMGLCGCVSEVVVAVLEKKRQRLTGLRVTATATQAGLPPRVFTEIRLTYAINGEVSHKAAKEAVTYARKTYRPVSKMLEKSATIEDKVVYTEGEFES
jgi:putative redox protein